MGRDIMPSRRSFPADPIAHQAASDFLREQLASSALSAERRDQIVVAVEELLQRPSREGGNGEVELRIRIGGRHVEVEVLDEDSARRTQSQSGITLVSFAEWLSSKLRERGLSQEAAARSIGVSLKTVSRWVHGETEPRLRELRRIKDAFGELPPLERLAPSPL
jgi:DNA-binding XRE family transcriptional regulator